MANIFQKIAYEAMGKGLFARLSKKATEWFQNRAKIVQVGRSSLLEDPELTSTPRSIGSALIGNLYYFSYDPKGKKSLPYYDTFPIVLVTEMMPKGFLGINFHYLGPRERGMLMDLLLELGAETAAVNDDPAPNSKLGKAAAKKLKHKQLEVLAALDIYKPTLKHYLFNHIRSRMVQVAVPDWDVAVFLPVAKFVGANSNQVFEDSLAALRK